MKDDPSEEEIATLCTEIQKGWSEKEKRIRGFGIVRQMGRMNLKDEEREKGNMSAYDRDYAFKMPIIKIDDILINAPDHAREHFKALLSRESPCGGYL